MRETVHFTDVLFSVYVEEKKCDLLHLKKRFPDANLVHKPFYFLSEETISCVTLSFVMCRNSTWIIISPLETKHSSFPRKRGVSHVFLLKTQ